MSSATARGSAACEKGQQWQRALALLIEMREAKLEANVISHNVVLNACEKAEQWQQSLALLSAMRETKVEPGVISYGAGIGACEKGEQWQRAVLLFSEMGEATVESNSATALGSAHARRVSSGCGLCRCSARCGTRSWSPTSPLFSYSVGISACAKGEQWQRALALLSEMREEQLEPDSAATLESARARRASNGAGL
ncbi:unnamed protein product [Prorocentrum cordatum]|uniref:Pentacotripeptide-repeat region of PRORP domain-containing protein n=1 Tax=Prorocentrum cordatum TaxID=2364126 RepID=A0ABN9T8P2_9DINO|nr:unnamed protein product [Polarella glacialis]